jgi:general transcription factor 3C polypeptide 3 (transcription factor C subunit 4)
MEVLVLTNLYNTLGEHDKVVSVIRGGVRWLQGRREQRCWEKYEDDREFDLLE